MNMNKRAISEIVDLNPRIPTRFASDLNREVDFVPMAQLSEHGYVTPIGGRQLGDVLKSYTYFENGDVIIAKITPCMENGKAAFVDNLPHQIGFGSTEFHVLRPRDSIDGRYLFYMVWNSEFRKEAERNMTGSAGQKRVPKSFFDRFKIPLPSLSEQKRIADILHKADSIRRKRKAALAEFESLSLSAYHDQFGYPIAANDVVPLGECVTIVSGGTPSKSNGGYWNGSFPWVSPKDMKVDYLSAAEDHVTDLAFQETSLKKLPPASILIVVRGMILAHTIPVALTDVPVAINQDMKALIPLKGYDPHFICWSLKAAHGYILGKVATAAHGTKRLEVEHIATLPIPRVPLTEQMHFARMVRKIRDSRSRLIAAEPDDLFNSLAQRAFKGEL